MKTAEEILNEHEDIFYIWDKISITKAMREYAEQVVEETVNEVKNRLNEFSIDFGGLSTEYETIIDTTPIQLP